MNSIAHYNPSAVHVAPIAMCMSMALPATVRVLGSCHSQTEFQLYKPASEQPLRVFGACSHLVALQRLPSGSSKPRSCGRQRWGRFSTTQEDKAYMATFWSAASQCRTGTCTRHPFLGGSHLPDYQLHLRQRRTQCACLHFRNSATSTVGSWIRPMTFS